MLPDVALDAAAERLVTWIRWRQGLAARLDGALPASVIGEIRSLVNDLPRGVDASEALVVRQVVGSALSELLVRKGLQDDSAIATSIVTLLGSPLAADDWRGRLLHAIDEVGRHLEDAAGGDHSPLDSSLVSILAALDANFRNSTLTLSVLAAQVNLSPWHVVRLLRTQTGRGFVGHLRERRVAEAGRLLLGTRLNGKQIAAEVGYRHPRQLGRDFRQIYGITPTAFRRRSLGQRVVRMPRTDRRAAKNGQQ